MIVGMHLCSRTCCALCPPHVPQSTPKTCLRSRSSQKILGWKVERQKYMFCLVHQKDQTAPVSNTTIFLTLFPTVQAFISQLGSWFSASY